MSNISNYTKLFVDRLPYWFKIKKNPNESIGLQFLNAFGLEFDDMRYILEYAFKQIYINEMDINYLNLTYKGYISNINDFDKIKYVKSDYITLTEAIDLSDFFNITFDYYENKSNYDDDVYILDSDKGVIYVKKEYDKNDTYKYGKIRVEYINGNVDTVELMPHSVWNYFDELGLLVNCPRLENESNFDYKERILNVFKYEQGSHKEGFLNALSNELSIRKTIIWEDTTKDLVIKDNMVILNRITVDKEILSLDNVYRNDYGNVVLKGSYAYPENIEVSYIKDLEVHFLYEKNDSKLQSELINIDGTATNLLKNYFNKIHTISPIVWDKFIWDRSYWNITDKQVGGKAFIPNLYDGNIEGFKNYLK